MKRALFGSGRTKNFTVKSLERLIREIEAQENDYKILGEFLSAPGYTPNPMDVGPTGQQIGQPPPIPPVRPSNGQKRTVDELLKQYGRN